jgi:MFS family permease
MLAKSMFVLSVIGLIDSISYMAVSPSLIFYVLELGGSKEQYGLVMSTFSFASFSAKPIYGVWVDKGGNKFRIPYLSSLAISVTGAILYFLAVQASTPAIAVAMIFVGRFLSGLGAANQALGYAYIASVVPQEMQTRTSTLLSMMRIIGMTVGPGINFFLDKVDSSFLGVPVDSLNSVGLLLAVGNLLTALTVFFLFPEPPEKEDKDKLQETDAAATSAASGGSKFWNACLSIDIVLPALILFVSNSAFQLIETALPAAASDGLGWGPVETSGVLGGTSIVIFGLMILVMFLSSKQVSDTALVVVGNVFFAVGGICIYFFWTDIANVWHYVVPVMIAVAGFPFIASPNRSNFTKAVMSKPVLESSQATMQAMLSMMASAAGFT